MMASMASRRPSPVGGVGAASGRAAAAALGLQGLHNRVDGGVKVLPGYEQE